MGKITVGVLFGGQSSEHKVSLKSAYTIITNLDRENYEPVLIGIAEDGKWKLYEGPLEAIPQDTWEQSDCTPVMLLPDPSQHGLLKTAGGVSEKLHLDVVFPVLHGKNGEDGKIQSLLELAGIPYVGCGVLSSAMCMDKDVSHRVVKEAGIRVPESIALTGAISEEQLAKVMTGFNYPVFVKPVSGGSSYGVTKVEEKSKLVAAIREAQKYDTKIGIEEGIDGCEVGCSILGHGDDLTVGEVDQIVVTNGYFHIHQDMFKKTGLENASIHVPAQLPQAVQEKIKDTAKAIFRALCCTGIARVDLFLTPDNEVVFNEVNTMPGFTSYSRYPRMMEAAGISVTEITDHAIQLALENAN
ncbi:D-alanine--D-alanine ligase family protein [Sporolactobacillus terrae]|uniref:D-alanine--D-alanine ligase n=1 Tax=Sporolactobacillus terrae TaxID=269673 RepID=A0A410D782_9BACL|nr:D-alanine--D-alanine ligase family protein [Sporolactobacillus terrae]QAA21974.1 D-alanine--D-alanine ligase [Sporolactobacillus terrae]QAA24947.1 D-alanine--D-alanine ligase [Sporolactobacillus terrae]UAK16770.1 D-alanine--D-alanine ligase [Sporolactobacillus terrae]BBN98251.1 putative D-alanine--D-lactate ligase [Sporolactobacillus terrae]